MQHPFPPYNKRFRRERILNLADHRPKKLAEAKLAPTLAEKPESASPGDPADESDVVKAE